MIDLIVIAGIAVSLVGGLGSGYLLGRKKETLAPKNQPITNRCEDLILLSGTKSDNDRSRIRCELPVFHTGPHLSHVPARYTNVGEEVWWKNEDNLIDQIKDLPRSIPEEPKEVKILPNRKVKSKESRIK